MCPVYQLGPRSWRPDDSLSQTVAENDAKQTCQLSRDILQSEMLPSADDEDLLLKPTDEVDCTSNSQWGWSGQVARVTLYKFFLY